MLKLLIIIFAVFSLNTAQSAPNPRYIKRIPLPGGYSNKNGQTVFIPNKTETPKVWGLERVYDDIVDVAPKLPVPLRTGTRYLPQATSVAASFIARNPAVIAGLVAAGGAVALSSWLRESEVQLNKDGTGFVVPDPKACAADPCYEYRINTYPYQWTSDPSVAAQQNVQIATTSSTTWQYQGPHPDGHNFYYALRTYLGKTDAVPQKSSLVFKVVPLGTAQPVPITESQIQEKLENKQSVVTPQTLQQLPIELPVDVVFNPDENGFNKPITQSLGTQQISENPPIYRHREVTVTQLPYNPAYPNDIELDVQEKITDTTSPDPTKPTDPTQDPSSPEYCVANPQSPACQNIKFGLLTPTPINNQTKDISEIKPVSGFQQQGSCPAPKTIMVSGHQIEFSLQLICDYAGMIRPILIGFAWLAATMTFFGFMKRD